MSTSAITQQPLPRVIVATFCEHVLEERDGVHSLIRIFDTLNLPADTPNGLASLGLLPLTAFILLKSDEATGSYRFNLRANSPSGEQLAMGPDQELRFTGGLDGSALTANLGL